MIKFYKVSGCKITTTAMFNGYVVCPAATEDHNANVIYGIKKKHNINPNTKLLCEITGESFEFDEIDPYSIPLTSLTVGEFMLANNFYNGFRMSLN